MGNRGPFRFLATAVSGQSNQRRKDHWERSATDKESSQHRFENGGQYVTGKQYVSGSAVSSIQNSARCPHCDQGHGGQVGAIGVPHAALWDQVHGPRCEVLRGPTSRSTDQTAQVESCQARISSRPTSCSLKRGSFWGAKSRFPKLLKSLGTKIRNGVIREGSNALQVSRTNHTCTASVVAWAETRGATNLWNWTDVGPTVP